MSDAVPHLVVLAWVALSATAVGFLIRAAIRKATPLEVMNGVVGFAGARLSVDLAGYPWGYPGPFVIFVDVGVLTVNAIVLRNVIKHSPSS